MNDMLKAAIRQSTADVLTIYRGLRDTLGDDVAPEQRDVVAATLTDAIITRIGQVADSLD